MASNSILSNHSQLVQEKKTEAFCTDTKHLSSNWTQHTSIPSIFFFLVPFVCDISNYAFERDRIKCFGGREEEKNQQQQLTFNFFRVIKQFASVWPATTELILKHFTCQKWFAGIKFRRFCTTSSSIWIQFVFVFIFSFSFSVSSVLLFSFFLLRTKYFKWFCRQMNNMYNFI